MRDHLPGLTTKQAVAFDILGFATHDRADQAYQIVWVHLPVPSHHRYHITMPKQCLFIACDNGCPHPLIVDMVDEHEAMPQPHMVRGDNVRRTICAGILNDNDEVDKIWHSVKDFANEFLFIVRRHYYCNCFPLVHVTLLASSDGRAMLELC